MSEVFESNETAEIRHNPWILGVVALLPLLALGAVVVHAVRSEWFVAFPYAYMLLPAIVSLGFAGIRKPRPRIVPAAVRADRASIRVGYRFVPRAALSAGFVVREPSGSVKVVLGRRLLPSIEVRVRDATEGRRLLHALGFDVSQTLATFLTDSRERVEPRAIYATLGVPCLAVVAVMLAGIKGAAGEAVIHGAIAVGLLGLLSTLTLVVIPTRFSVGSDGLMLRWLGKERFLAYRDILALSRYEEGQGEPKHTGLVIALENEEIRIPLGQESRLALVEERINEAMGIYRQDNAQPDESMLRRGARSIASWIVALRSIGAGASAGPRMAAMPEDRLWRIVEDARADQAVRAAAAIALGAGLDDDRRTRLHAAAQVTVAPRLRIGIEKVAEGPSDAVLEAMLAELEDEDVTAAKAARR